MAKLRSINPTDGEIIGSVKIATKAEVEETTGRAKKAFIDWRQTPLKKRAKMLLKLADLLEKNTKKIAEMITIEMGKPITEAVDEVSGSVEDVRYFAKEGARVLQDEVIRPKPTQKLLNGLRKKHVADVADYLNKKGEKEISILRYDPIGVVAVIKPWNYPVGVPIPSIASALVAGNVVVFKPSEEVPLVSSYLAELIWQAGVPQEVFQIIHGRSQVGAMIIDSGVDMVSFTGSSQVGKEIAEKCSKSLIKCVLEMGGSSPALVLSDADLDLAVEGIVLGRFSNCGQVCSAIKRVFVETSVAEAFTKQLAKRIEDLQVGDPNDDKTEIGPLVSKKQLQKLQDQITKGVIQGGRIIVGGRRMREEPFLKGFFHQPTLMIHVSQRTEIMQEEVFGPVLPICEVESFRSAIKKANDSKFGLTAVVFTKSKQKAQQAIRELKVGTVYVNSQGAWFPEAPWTGLKDSGVGVGYSRHGIWEYVNKKHVYIS